MRTYTELLTYSTFEDRFRYLKLDGKVGRETFGFDRYINQMFYTRDDRWKHVRNIVADRDHGCDLGVEGYDIFGPFYIHHMNPVTLETLEKNIDILLDPEFLVCTAFRTHNGIHFGRSLIPPESFSERTPYDTCPWR